MATHLDDVKNLSRTALREKYPREYNSWKGMLSRERKRGNVHPDFIDWVSFLRIMGPIPEPGMSLDRINHKNPMYSPANCRWADKKTQSINRSNVTIFTDLDGMRYSVSELAEKQKVSVSALHSRKRSGWMDHEIITGQRDENLRAFGWPHKYGRKLEEIFQSELQNGRVPLDMTRMQWLFNRSRETIRSLTYHFENYVDPNEPMSDSDRLKSEQYEKWQELYQFAEQSLREGERRRAIINRPGGLSRRLERQSYDAHRQHRHESGGDDTLA